MKYSSNLIPDCGLQQDNYLSQERHIWRGEGRGGAGLVMAETGNRREVLRRGIFGQERGGEGRGW